MRANVIIEKGTTDRRLVRIFVTYKSNRSVLQAGAVIFVSCYYLCRMCIRHRSRWVQSSRLQWNPKYSLAKPSFPVNTLSSFYVIRGLQMSIPLWLLQNKCQWHSATLCWKSNRLPLWQHPYFDYNSKTWYMQYIKQQKLIGKLQFWKY